VWCSVWVDGLAGLYSTNMSVWREADGTT